MSKKRREYDSELKAKILKRYAAGAVATDLAKEFGVDAGRIYSWSRRSGSSRRQETWAKGERAKLLQPAQPKIDGRLETWVKGERAQLLQLIGEQVLEIARLKLKAAR